MQYLIITHKKTCTYNRLSSDYLSAISIRSDMMQLCLFRAKDRRKCPRKGKNNKSQLRSRRARPERMRAISDSLANKSNERRPRELFRYKTEQQQPLPYSFSL